MGMTLLQTEWNFCSLERKDSIWAVQAGNLFLLWCGRVCAFIRGAFILSENCNIDHSFTIQENAYSWCCVWYFLLLQTPSPFFPPVLSWGYEAVCQAEFLLSLPMMNQQLLPFLHKVNYILHLRVMLCPLDKLWAWNFLFLMVIAISSLKSSLFMEFWLCAFF